MAEDTKSSSLSPFERALGIITEVRAGEGPSAILLTLNVFLLLTAYYTIKPVREALILSLDSGAEYSDTRYPDCFASPRATSMVPPNSSRIPELTVDRPRKPTASIPPRARSAAAAGLLGGGL